MPKAFDPSRGTPSCPSPFAFRRRRGARTLEALGLGLLLLLSSWPAPAAAQDDVLEAQPEAETETETETEVEAEQVPPEQTEPEPEPEQAAPEQPEPEEPAVGESQQPAGSGYDDVPPPEPGDLAVSEADARVSDDASTLEVRATVRNQGRGETGPAALDVSPDWGAGARSEVPPLEPGDSRSFEARLRVPRGVEAGRHQVRFAVRPDGSVPDANPRNDVREVEVTITGRPDLRVEEVVASPDDDGRTVAVRGVVRNSGESTAAPSRVEVATDWNVTEAIPIPELDAGRSAPFVFALPLPRGVPSGHHRIELLVRAADGRPDSNTENDRWVGRVALLGDLSLSRVELRTSDDASTARVRVTVRNDGIARTRRTELVLRTEWQETRRLPVPALDAGEARSFSVSFDLPGGVAKDRDAIRLVVDPRDAVDEADEGNNQERVLLELSEAPGQEPTFPEEVLSALVALGLVLAIVGAARLARHWFLPKPKVDALLVNDGRGAQRVTMSEPAERPLEILLRARVDRGRQEIRMAPELPEKEGDRWLRPTSP